MRSWDRTQLTFPGANGYAHAHSYYDIPVFDGSGRKIVAHRLSFEGRQPNERDAIDIGLVDADEPGSWDPIGTSRAWSWQQGPLAQWIAGGPRVVWNDSENGEHVARVFDTATRETKTLPVPVYCVDRKGTFALGVNMARLNTVRPGYGYAGGGAARLDEARPAEDGIWRMDLDSPSPQIVLTLARAVKFLYSRIGWKAWAKHRTYPYLYWFNHVKLSPDGKRFTVKLRWRRMSRPRRDRMGVSLTCNVDGSDLRLLASATSHVIWKDDSTLYCWKEGLMREYEDRAPQAKETDQIAPDLIGANVHLRHLDPDARYYVFDTPYREEIDLITLDRRTGDHETIAHFTGHSPSNGEFRCDLHPCPNDAGDRIIVTSMERDGRQLYLLSRNG